jgi:hypothetical protein
LALGVPAGATGATGATGAKGDIGTVVLSSSGATLNVPFVVKLTPNKLGIDGFFVNGKRM